MPFRATIDIVSRFIFIVLNSREVIGGEFIMGSILVSVQCIRCGGCERCGHYLKYQIIHIPIFFYESAWAWYRYNIVLK